MRISPALRRAFLLGAAALSIAAATAATPYNTWAAQYGLTGAQIEPVANPDGDRFANALEYAFGTNPNVPEKDYSVAPALEAKGDQLQFVYRVHEQADGGAVFQVMKSTDMKTWTPAPGKAKLLSSKGGIRTFGLDVPSGAKDAFYELQVSVEYTPAGSDEPVSETIAIGANVGSDWDGLPPIPSVVIRTSPPVAKGTNAPDISKYPEVVGTSLNSFSPGLLADYKAAGQRPPLRSWLGFFLWGNGTPPPGLSAGYPVTGTFDSAQPWDYFAYQYPTGTTSADTGSWKPIRLDQQPLYATPLILNYAWPPGQFGYVTQPLAPFGTQGTDTKQVGYWGARKIVRGVNLSQATPFYYQYGNVITVGNTPAAWRQAWFYAAMTPLETTVVVPGNLKPDALLADGAWNDIGTGNPQSLPQNQPFPYPVWDTTLPAKDQTPFNIQVDRIGDFDTDLVWEGTNPQSSTYAKNHYVRTTFAQPGQGNYFKMTVAQGSPLVWCETNNNRYATFYNLIRTNVPGQIDNNTGTGAQTVAGGPWPVPGVTGVSYVLLYGDQTNPNQWYHDTQPQFYDSASGNPGGFNPPGAQHNFTYTAVYYRTDTVQPVTLGTGGTSSADSNGTDAQGNPYFYLEFKNPAKNWFVVGAVPVMHYYASGVTPDDEATRTTAARNWAEEMGQYAFNFPTGSKVSYNVTNMYQANTTYGMTFANPYVATGAPSAAGMTAAPDQTVLALLPHQYQPLTLGPDLTKTARTPVVWSPLRAHGQDFAVTSPPPNANKSTSTSQSNWGYWSLKGNLKPIIAGSFTTAYPFQNFLPVMPSPDWTRKFDVNGVQLVNITNVGTGNVNVTVPPTVTLDPIPITGSGATFQATLDPDGHVNGVTVLTGGSGYPNGFPPGNMLAQIAAPPAGGTTATANVEVVGGIVKSVSIIQGGSGYGSTPPAVTLAQAPFGTGVKLTALLEPNTGRVQQINVDDGGTKYPTGNPATFVNVNIAPPTSPTIANGGIQATAYAQINGDGAVLAIFMIDKGFGYSPTITVQQAGLTQQPIIVPTFAPGPDGALLAGPATVVAAGSGFDITKPYTITVNGTGTGAVASIVAPGTVYKIGDPGVPGFASGGSYPSSGNSTDDAARIKVTVASTPDGSAAQAAKVLPEGIVYLPGASSSVLTSGGTGYQASPATTATFTDDNGGTFQYNAIVAGGNVVDLTGPTAVAPTTGAPKITTPRPLTFSGGAPTTPASGDVYALFTVDTSKVVVDGAQPVVSGYTGDADVTFSGGDIETTTAVLPKINFSFTSDGQLDRTSLSVDSANPGKGWFGNGAFTIQGGRGFNAMLQPFVDSSTASTGTIIGVKVLRGGSGYLNPVGGVSRVFATTIPPDGGAKFDVVVKDGSIVAVNVLQGGKYGAALPPIVLTSKEGSISPDADNPKGPPATVSFQPNGTGGIQNLTVIDAGGNYVPGSELKGSATTPQATVSFGGRHPIASPTSYTQGLIANVIPPQTQVAQVFYDTLIANYTTYSQSNVAPFGGAFQGNSAPDGYGLGNQLEAAGKFMGDLFNFQQYTAAADPSSPDQPDLAPSAYAVNAAKIPSSAFAQASLQTNSPIFSLSGALKLSVQSLQRSISLLFDSNLVGNSPSDMNTWQMDYFNLYDQDAGRVVVNPTSTIPVAGVVSTSANPPAEQNDGKTGLIAWQPGRLWSGFGVSDQWNDQHYFYGYYLGTAALAGIFDHSWDPVITGKPDSLWAGPNQMGTAIDQWLMTLAYDPDNAALNSSLYKNSALTYQKFAFFDQWNGHGWATGVSPAPSGGVETSVPWSLWHSYGTGTSLYNQENENSIFEGIQAWSATVLWGGATDRKPVVDLGIYLMATEMAAGDLYFLDKNYNQGVSPNNPAAWVPVTTVAASSAPNNGGNTQPAGTDYVSSANPAFFTAPEFYGGAAAAGVSTVKKVANSMDNFFYAYPTGSKLIQAFPPTPWTLSISRNSDYMRRWAGAWMRQEWTDARNSSLFSAPDWLTMSMTAALCGVPYEPGDVPYPLTGTTPTTTPILPPYVDRLWSQWVTQNAPAGNQAPIKGFVNQTSVLSFLLSLDQYGTPDWTYLGKATDSTGAEKNDSIVYTAAFSKVVGGNVVTTFVSFNPGWETRYAKFYRLGADGSTGPVASGPDPIAVLPKHLVVTTVTIPIL